MKAVICEAFGPIRELKFGDIAPPELGSHDVLIMAEAMGVNFPDGLLVQGLYQARPPTPFVPGMEVVGEVVAVGEKVTRCKKGDRVGAVVTFGAFAEMVRADEKTVMAVPAGLDAGEVTALMIGYGTAHYALKQRGKLVCGETLAVSGASGLTGLASVQIGKLMGAKVIAIASSDEKRRIAADNGADITLSYDNLKDALKEATLGKGVDVAFDGVGGEVFGALSRSMAWGGRLMVIGFASGNIPQFSVNLALVKGYSVVGVFWGNFIQKEPFEYAANMAQLLDWYREGKVKPLIEKTYRLADAIEALEHIHSRRAVGKLVLRP